jgi:hypothetical protein
VVFELRHVAHEGLGAPAPIVQGGDQAVGADAAGRPVDQGREVLSARRVVAPVTLDHRGGGAPAQVVVLADEGHVEDGRRRRRRRGDHQGQEQCVHDGLRRPAG